MSIEGTKVQGWDLGWEYNRSSTCGEWCPLARWLMPRARRAWSVVCVRSSAMHVRARRPTRVSDATCDVSNAK